MAEMVVFTSVTTTSWGTKFVIRRTETSVRSTTWELNKENNPQVLPSWEEPFDLLSMSSALSKVEIVEVVKAN